MDRLVDTAPPWIRCSSPRALQDGEVVADRRVSHPEFMDQVGNLDPALLENFLGYEVAPLMGVHPQPPLESPNLC